MRVVNKFKPHIHNFWKGKWYNFENGEIAEVPEDFPLRDGLEIAPDTPAPKSNYPTEPKEGGAITPVVPKAEEPKVALLAKPRRRRK